MLLVNIIGWLATISTTTRLLPQLYVSITTKKTKDLSLLFLLTAVFGNINWIIFAAYNNNIQLVVNDTICIILNMSLIGLKLFYDKKNKKHYKCDISGN